MRPRFLKALASEAKRSPAVCGTCTQQPSSFTAGRRTSAIGVNRLRIASQQAKQDERAVAALGLTVFLRSFHQLHAISAPISSAASALCAPVAVVNCVGAARRRAAHRFSDTPFFPPAHALVAIRCSSKRGAARAAVTCAFAIEQRGWATATAAQALPSLLLLSR